MDTEQLRQNAAAMLAFADGKKVQLRYTGEPGHEWTDAESPKFQFHDHEYRVKPEPVSRPWSKPEDVPGPVCWIKRSYAEGCAMITGIDSAGVLLAAGINIKWFTFEQYDSQYEHSTDRKTWLPCTVTEDAK